jgi:hypothetical protein
MLFASFTTRTKRGKICLQIQLVEYSLDCINKLDKVHTFLCCGVCLTAVRCWIPIKDFIGIRITKRFKVLLFEFKVVDFKVRL